VFRVDGFHLTFTMPHRKIDGPYYNRSLIIKKALSFERKGELAVFRCPPFRHRLCLLCVLAMWGTVGVSAATGENFHEDVYLRERLLQRAKAYLNSCGKGVISHALVVRGLLYAGFSLEHPFVRSKIDMLSRLTPCNDIEATRQREIALLVRASENRNAFPPSKNDAATLRAAVVSDYCNDHYKRYGVVRLPGPANNAPPPEHDPGRFMGAVPFSPIPSRSLDVAPTLNDNVVSSRSIDRPCRVDIGKSTGYILVAQTVQLRN